MKAKVVVGVMLLILSGSVFLLLVKEGQKVNFNINYTPVQPISFSHKIHAGENKIACQYCHFAAEKGRHAGIPPSELCMNCHKIIKKDSPEVQKIAQSIVDQRPIEWIKVHHFPDFAYFNHSQHVRVGKVSCQSCHGPVETMTRVRQDQMLSMGQCIECHRKSSIAPPNDHKSRAGGDCARCHY